MNEARRVIRRLERIETLQGAQAPAADLLAEVRLLLREGEAWLAAEQGEVATAGGEGGRAATAAAEAALRGCRATIGEGEVVAEAAGRAAL